MSRYFSSNLNQNNIAHNEICVTLGLKISQGALHGTWLCSEASRTLLNGIINNNKAIIFLFFICGYWSILAVSALIFFPVSSLLLQACPNATEPKKLAKFHCPQNKTQTPSWKITSWLTAMPYHHTKSNNSEHLTICKLRILWITECFCIYKINWI